jgi:hypothetical protein
MKWSFNCRAPGLQYHNYPLQRHCFQLSQLDEKAATLNYRFTGIDASLHADYSVSKAV